MPAPPERPPPSDDEFKGRVYSYVLDEERRRNGDAIARQELQKSVSAVLREVHDTRTEMRTGFESVDQRFRGLERRVTALEDPSSTPVPRRRPSPAPMPISIPPARAALDTGEWTKKSKAEAEIFIEHRAREIAEEAVANARRDDQAESWRNTLSISGKIAVVVLGGLLLTASGYALSKCTSTATIVVPSGHP